MSKKIENEVVETVETVETEVVEESKLKKIKTKVGGGIKKYGKIVAVGAAALVVGGLIGRNAGKNSEVYDDYCDYSEEPAEDSVGDFADVEA